MNAIHPIARFVHGFFQDYLAAQRGLSPNTIFGYRDSLKLFLRFVSEHVRKSVDKLTLERSAGKERPSATISPRLMHCPPWLRHPALDV